VAARLRRLRHQQGALDLQSLEIPPRVSVETRWWVYRAEEPNRAKQLIEDFMIAANGVVAPLSRRQGPALFAPCGALA